MRLKITRRRKTPEGSIDCELELELDDALLAYPTTIRERIAAARAAAEHVLADQVEPSSSSPPSPSPAAVPVTLSVVHPEAPVSAPTNGHTPLPTAHCPLPTADSPSPWTGARLWDWCASSGRAGWFVKHGEARGYPRKIRDWTEAQVSEAQATFKACRGTRGAWGR